MDNDHDQFWAFFRQKKFVNAQQLVESHAESPYSAIDLLIVKASIKRVEGDLAGSHEEIAKAIKLAENQKYYQGYGYALLTEAETYYKQGNLEKSEIMAKKAYKAFSKPKIHIQTGKLDSTNFLGRIAYARGNYDDCMVFIQKTLKTAKKLGFVNDIVRAYNNIAVLMDFQGQRDEAIKTYKDAIEIALANEEGKYYLGTLYNNLAEVEQLQGHFNQAEKDYLDGLRHSEESNSRPDSAALIHQNLGCLYSEQGKYTEAEKSFAKSVEIYNRIDSKINLPAVYGEMAQHARRKGELSTAKQHFELSIRLYNEQQHFDEIYQQTLCNYVDLLGTLHKEEEAYLRLREANDLAIRHSAKLEKLRVELQVAKLASSHGDFNQAIFLLEEVIRNAEVEKAYIIEVEAHLTLAESLLFKYKLLVDESSLERLKESIAHLIQVTKTQNLLPSFIRSQFLKAILLYSPNDRETSISLLNTAIKLAEQNGILNLEQYGKTLQSELTRHDLSEYEMLDILTRNIKTISYRMVITPELRRRLYDTAMLFIGQSTQGPTILASENIETALKSVDYDTLFKLSTFLTIAIGQGSSYHRGLYGPLPIPDRADFITLLYAFTISDRKIQDPRFQGKNYVMITLLMPIEVSNFFYDRPLIQRIFEEALQSFPDITNITQSTLFELRKKLLENCIPEWKEAQ